MDAAFVIFFLLTAQEPARITGKKAKKFKDTKLSDSTPKRSAAAPVTPMKMETPEKKHYIAVGQSVMVAYGKTDYAATVLDINESTGEYLGPHALIAAILQSQCIMLAIRIREMNGNSARPFLRASLSPLAVALARSRHRAGLSSQLPWSCLCSCFKLYYF
jgi:hypothetical protein